MSKTNVGMNAIYNGGLTPGYLQSGGGLINFGKKAFNAAQKANQFLKQNKVGTKIRGIADAAGLTERLNNATGGQFTNLTDKAIKRGYGKKKRGGRKRKN